MSRSIHLHNLIDLPFSLSSIHHYLFLRYMPEHTRLDKTGTLNFEAFFSKRCRLWAFGVRVSVSELSLSSCLRLERTKVGCIRLGCRAAEGVAMCSNASTGR